MHRSQNAVEANQVPGTSRNLWQLIQLQQLSRGSEAEGTATRGQIEELRAAIPDELLRSFDSAAQRGRAAVAWVSESGGCGGCHLKLPAGMAARIEVLKEQIHKCPYCGCFLYSSMIRFSSGQSSPLLPSSRRPGRLIRVVRAGSASRFKARARVFPTGAPDAAICRQQDSSL